MHDDSVEKTTTEPPSQLGRWSLGKKIGSGAFGSIYDATDSKAEILGEWVIKVTKVTKASVDLHDRSRKTRIERLHAGALTNERLVYGKLACFGSGSRSDVPSNPKEHHFGKEAGWVYIVMNKIEGKSLKEYSPAETGEPVDPAWLRSVAVGLVRALEFVHSTQFAHMDVKPANIVIRRDTQKPVLLDFGVSTMMLYAHEAKNVGTLEFMSRKLHHGAYPCRYDDLESLMYTMVWVYRGKLPWSGRKTSPEIAAQKKKFKCEGDIPEGFSLVWKMIAEPEDRLGKPDYDAICALLGEPSEKKSRKRTRSESDDEGSPRKRN